jgi:hypothetical protein
MLLIAGSFYLEVHKGEAPIYILSVGRCAHAPVSERSLRLLTLLTVITVSTALIGQILLGFRLGPSHRSSRPSTTIRGFPSGRSIGSLSL